MQSTSSVQALHGEIRACCGWCAAALALCCPTLPIAPPILVLHIAVDTMPSTAVLLSAGAGVAATQRAPCASNRRPFTALRPQRRRWQQLVRAEGEGSSEQATQQVRVAGQPAPHYQRIHNFLRERFSADSYKVNHAEYRTMHA